MCIINLSSTELAQWVEKVNCKRNFVFLFSESQRENQQQMQHQTSFYPGILAEEVNAVRKVSLMLCTVVKSGYQVKFSYFSIKTYVMGNSLEAPYLDLHYLQRLGISRFSRTRVNIFNRQHFEITCIFFFLFSLRKQNLTFQANCLKFAWNVKACFLKKIRKKYIAQSMVRHSKIPMLGANVAKSVTDRQTDRKIMLL